MKDEKNEFYYYCLCRIIKDILKECGITYKEIYNKLGMKETNFNNKINNIHGKFSVFQLKKIADELAESLDDLIERAIKMAEKEKI